MEYFYLILFAAFLLIKVKKDYVFILAFLPFIITNINSLLKHDSFGVGSLNFADYIFPVTVFIYVNYKFKSNLFFYYKNSLTYKLLIFYILYQFFLIFYSLYINKEDDMWILKIGRYQFYGLFILLTFLFIEKNPVDIFSKFLFFLNNIVIFFTILFLIDSLLGFSIFVLYDSHKMITDAGIELKRNFYAYPIFSGYFYIYNLQKLIQSKTKKQAFRYSIFLLILLLAVVAIMTRGVVIAVLLTTIILIWLNNWDFRKRLILIIIVSLIISVGIFGVLNYFPEYVTLIDRFFEVKHNGLSGTANFQVREYWLSKAISNVNSFNPYFGFGYIRPDQDIYKFMSFSAGNPDNAFANIIGMQGYFGLFIFCALVSSWLVTNIKLQKLNKEGISKVNFVYIIWMLISTQNSNSFSYFQNFGFFLAYDLIAYQFFRKINLGLIIKNQISDCLSQEEIPLSKKT